jgi:Flp pilus assembly protein TadD
MFSLVDVIRRLQIEAGSVVDLEVAVFAADHGDPAAAVAAARAAYQARPGNVYAADALGWALMSSGDPLAAVRYAREAVRLDSADPGIHFHAAAVLAAAGETTAARHHLERVLDLNPRYTPTIAAGVGPLAAELGVPA